MLGDCELSRVENGCRVGDLDQARSLIALALGENILDSENMQDFNYYCCRAIYQLRSF